MRILSCLVVAHNLWLVLLALLVGIAGSWVTFRLFRQAQARQGRQRAGWVLLASQAAGSSIWCMHFIAVVAYDAGAAFTFDPAWTMVSLFVAVTGCAYGFWIALSNRFRAAPEMGGAVVGLAISAMHYSGMLAFRIDGLIEWQAGYILLSVAFAVFFGVLTLRQAVRPFVRESGYLVVGLFVLAVVSLHFTGMAAFAVTPIAAGGESISAALAAFAVVGVGMLVVGSGVISYLLDEQASQETLRRLEHLALHDALTGLANRPRALAHLDGAFAQADKSGEKVAVIGIDLDRFKEINDVYGHKAGDDVLVTISGRLADLLREGEFVARIGGDEFMAVKRFSDHASLDSFLVRLDAALSMPLSVAGSALPSTASIGVAIYPDDGADREMLICHADMAMYQSKHDLSRRISFYEQAMERATLERFALAQDLGRALDLGQFTLHYQVQKSVASGDIVGYEALLRWNHPLQGSISPAVFIPIAEETGHILAIGEWVLRTACAEAATWDAPHKVAVNLSPVQVINADIPGLLRAVLVETGLSPKRLDLEITESTFIADKAKALRVLRQVKALGVSLSIDDFGVGYSSFDTLRSFPFDKIKIDGCFTRDADRSSEARAILRSVLALGRSLGIPVLAEGVETADQLARLRAEGCAEAQGYHLGKPMPMERARPIAMRAG
ncbi:EAL domain-containing protein [Shinella curvata]|uniref:EAL domain-containing protein n=1 Tax=Shinella curvata TaxID=1817964 RepID=A0ABT8XA30_9HYPH|nr:EAL domain-containing protein [Shinella curvata]MCJ8055021.1 EAL domain-containing protein [Shinella curvata]MDO6120583.1 EAL domain-containing protein [Shinella curvata]